MGSAQAAEWSLDWGGFFNAHLVYSSEDGNDATDGFDVLTNAEILFDPSITLDNGLTFGVHVELEAEAGGIGATLGDPADPTDVGNLAGERVDESWMYVSGSFGEVRLGAEDSPFGTMMYGAPSYMAGVTSGTLTGTYLPSSYGALGNAAQLAGDATRIVYYTPRFSGFQIGASYARAASSDDRAWDNRDTLTSDILSLGANYDGSFGSTTVQVAATYEQADAVGGGTPRSFSVGTSLGFGAFTVGGGYAHYDADAGSNSEADFFNLGVGYATGPWGVALAGSYSDPDGDDNEVSQISLNGKYDLGPGVSVRAFVGYAETEASDLEGFAVGTGFNLAF
jgi:hypothetical protein